jgi:hypothetical protein
LQKGKITIFLVLDNWERFTIKGLLLFLQFNENQRVVKFSSLLFLTYFSAFQQVMLVFNEVLN